MDADLVIENVLLPDPAKPGKRPRPGFLALRGESIAAAGFAGEQQPPAAAAALDGAGRLAVPGLKNHHCHAAMTLFRGLADDLELTAWLHSHIFPAEARHVSEEMVYWCSLLAAAELLLSGTTTVCDGYFFEDAAARAFADAGIRAVAAQAVIDFPTPDLADPARNIAHAGRFLAAWQDRDPLVRPAVFAHSPYTCGNDTLVRARELARKHGVPFFIHTAETRDEQGMIHAPLGPTPVQHLDRLGVLDNRTVLVHCVWCDARDLDTIAERGCSIVLCPQSHAKLASGIAPLPAMLRRNIPVALGTDGPASNNGLDLFRELDFCAKLQKLHDLDPVAVPAGRILAMATSVLPGCFPPTAPGLHPGAPADVLLIEVRRPHLQPLHGLDALVYAAGGADVHTVFVAGRKVVEAGQLRTQDLGKVRQRVRRLARQVAGRA